MLDNDEPLPSQNMAPGSVLLGVYQVESAPNIGTFNATWRVKHLDWGINLAMRQPIDWYRRTENREQSFWKECELLLSLGQHPNILNCIHLSEINSVPTIFSAWMDAGTLATAISSGALYTGSETEQLARILDISLQCARGLQFLHEQEHPVMLGGYIHHDVKPENLLLNTQWQAKLTGLDGAASPAGVFTPAYASPEQLNVQTITKHTDMYSWALSVLEMFIGHRPWNNGAEAGAACAEYFEQARVEIPVALEELLTECLQSKNTARPPDFTAVGKEIEYIYQAEIDCAYPRPQPPPSPKTAALLNNQAISLLTLGKHYLAHACWEQALELDPTHAETRYNQARQLWQEAKTDDLEAINRLATTGSADAWELAYYQALLHLERGDWQQAGVLLAQIPAQAQGDRRVKDASQMVAANKEKAQYFELNYPPEQSGAQPIALSTADNSIVLALLKGEDVHYLEWWDTTNKTQLSRIKIKGALTCAAISSDGAIAAIGCEEGIVLIWKMGDLDTLGWCEGHSNAVTTVGFLPESNQVFSADAGGEIIHWAGIEEGEKQFGRCPGRINSLCCTTDGKYLLTAGQESTVRVWDVDTASCKSVLVEEFGELAAVAAVPGYRYALAGGEGNTLRLWDLGEELCVRKYHAHSEQVQGIHLVPGGKYALIKRGKTSLLDLKTGVISRTFTDIAESAELVAVDSQGNMLALTGAGLRVWGLPVLEYAPHLVPSRVESLEVGELGESRGLAEVSVTGPVGPVGPVGPTGPTGPTGPVGQVGEVLGDLGVGEVVLGIYEVCSGVLAGGMGRVWRVHHLGWGVDLALKQPLPGLFARPGARELFVGECEAWIGLGLHPHIVSCYYVRDIGGVPAVFAEWMDGGSLREAISGGALYAGGEAEQLERVLDYAIQAARGLHYVHERCGDEGELLGLIHQDVKPDNLLLSLGGDLKVADFGIARARGLAVVGDGFVEGETLVAAGGGYTPAYASAEQVAGGRLTRRTDVYAWALSVLEMFLGQRLWVSGAVAGLSCEEYFAEARVEVPEAVRDLLRECLAKDEAQRPHDFGVIERELLCIYEVECGRAYPRVSSEVVEDTADSLNNRALSFLDLGQSEEAVKHWEKALLVDPNNTQVRYNQTIYQLHEGIITANEATRLLQISFENHMGASFISMCLAKLNLELGDFFNANGYLAQAGLNTKEATALQEAIDAEVTDYRCEYSLSRILDYQAQTETLAKFKQIEQEIRQLLVDDRLEAACNTMLMAAMSPDTYGFGLSPAGIQLSKELGRYGFIQWVIASWPVRKYNKRSASAVSFPLDGKSILVDDRCYELETGELIKDYAIACNPDGLPTDNDYQNALMALARMLGRDENELVDLWRNNESASPHKVEDGRPIEIYSKLNYDGSCFLTGNRGLVGFKVISACNGECTAEYDCHPHGITVLEISKDGSLYITGGVDGTIQIRQASTGECTGVYSNEDGQVRKIEVSYHNQYVAVMTDTMVKMWDIAEGVPGKTYKIEGLEDFCIDTRWNTLVLACGEKGLISVKLDTDEVTQHQDLIQISRGHHDQSAYAVCFMPNDQYVIAATRNALHIWILQRNTILSPIPIGSQVTAIATSADAEYLVVNIPKGVELLRSSYGYSFEEWSGWNEVFEPYAKLFLARYPNFTKQQFTDIFMKELRDRGFGCTIEEDAYRAVQELSAGRTPLS